MRVGIGFGSLIHCAVECRTPEKFNNYRKLLRGAQFT